MKFKISDLHAGMKIMYKAPKGKGAHEAIVDHTIEMSGLVYIRCKHCGCKYIGAEWVVSVISTFGKTKFDEANPNKTFRSG